MKQLTSLLALLFALVGTAAAQFSSPLEQFVVPVYPKPGVYYDPTQGGTGLTVDNVVVGANTYVFSTYYHYEATGGPTWLNLINVITQSSYSDYTANGLLASVRGEWTRSTGGACFDCPFAPITTVFPPTASAC